MPRNKDTPLERQGSFHTACVCACHTTRVGAGTEYPTPPVPSSSVSGTSDPHSTVGVIPGPLPTSCTDFPPRVTFGME